MANTIAAMVEPPGDSTVSATTSTGTSRIRISVSAFGRLSGNTRLSGYPATPSPGQVLDARGAPHRPERRDRRREQGPGEDAAPAAVRDQQAEHDPAHAVRPPERALGRLAEPADRDHDQRGEDADLHERVQPDRLEVGHEPQVMPGGGRSGA